MTTIGHNHFYIAKHVKGQSKLYSVLSRTTYNTNDCDRPWILVEDDSYEYVSMTYNEAIGLMNVLDDVLHPYVSMAPHNSTYPGYKIMAGDDLHEQLVSQGAIPDLCIGD